MYGSCREHAARSFLRWTGVVTKGDSARRPCMLLDHRRLHFAVTTPTAGTNRVNGDTEIAAGEWPHVWGTYDGAGIRLFVGGYEAPHRPVP